MADIDPELRDKIIETHTDMKHVRRNQESYDERLREVEQNQSRIMTYIIAIGAGITLAVNAVIHLLDKIWK